MDLHEIAFLDDASRFIMHGRLILDENRNACAAVLNETFPLQTLLASSKAIRAVSSRAALLPVLCANVA
jgi:hypothetical protein